MRIRQANASDLASMWSIFKAVISAGDALPFAADFDLSTFQSHWFASQRSYVAVTDAAVLGMYKFGANYPGLGSHVATATYLVDPEAQGLGVGRALVQHSLTQAKDAGYLAMQFNYVVSSNAPAVELYKKLGFAIVGTLPQAFRHRRLGLVDVYVMHRPLHAEDARGFV
ncbi:N-acetyltransferase [Xanthomonas nasturtii]|uniref:GNAT family N-acetyltransferase n=1 Tax=Xanthomonas nasturtii TaxID=1843581 RepID=UPI002B2320E5|nr:N-acetyltransferase [Xanthomonas nasturtii]MEA9579488.1 N-acetyltransferase [Xanthomonas nasturtii]